MHLKQLKIAGFKSFVDPTIVPFECQLVAVVGPNGCGKSNIIDAVRWVMGESHAKNLRGDSIVDVIFKGSLNRKPVGQASVELLFDNSLGRITGQYAAFREISVKRVVTRDAESSYFLNGTRCRRRDITDIFLGTGAGARGYSIIGQDTISRLVEARPDDLRLYLEEAAGVSKYKERRRETLQRMDATKENLARVADILAELHKQLARLERQAAAAMRYRDLKNEERACRTDILALKWQSQTIQGQQLKEELHQLTLQCDAYQRTIASLTHQSESLRMTLNEVNEHHRHFQAQYYQIATDIARLEETIAQRQRDQQQVTLDKAQLERDLQEAMHRLQLDIHTLQELEQAVVLLQERHVLLQQTFSMDEANLLQAEQEEAAYLTQWQQTHAALHDAKRDLELQEVRLQHLSEKRQTLHIMLEKTQQDHNAIDLDAMQHVLVTLEEQLTQMTMAHDEMTTNYENALLEGKQYRQQIADILQQLHLTQDSIQRYAVEHATLSAIQQKALSMVPQQLLEQQGWSEHSRLIDLMSASDEWLLIADKILGDSLHAVVLDSMETLWSFLPSLQGQFAVFVEKASSFESVGCYPTLGEKLGDVLPCWSYALHDILAAESLAEALEWFPNIQKAQSIVTRDGYWLGHGWVRVFNLCQTEDVGLLSRKQALQEVAMLLSQNEEALHQLMARRDELHERLASHERAQDELKETLHREVALRCLTETTYGQQKEKITKAQTLFDELSAAILSIQDDLEDASSEYIVLMNNKQLAEQRVLECETSKIAFIEHKVMLDEKLKRLRQVLDTNRTLFYQSQLQLGQETSKIEQLQKHIERNRPQIAILNERLDDLNKRLQALDTPDSNLASNLKQKVIEHSQLGESLRNKQSEMDALEQQLQEVLQNHQQEEASYKHTDRLQQQHALLIQTQIAKVEELLIQGQMLEVDFETILNLLPPETTIDMRERLLSDLEEKIRKMGAINLLAIEEYQTDLQRKESLEAQYEDLNSALLILESAILKLDKETIETFLETFNLVNASFQILFPRLFGGGHARLELTCDNLLEAGILVRAEPPGKRNTTIHMLSGGEKAMTAIALVIAIFQQNPSPFCMLDEVDAPLDDTNVGRFCELVKEMSPFVQFLFITHNKVTMALAEQLIGVTMREPGVSRIVAVDVESMMN